MDLADALGLGGRELVAFVGAGGKKTAMAALARTGADRDLAVGYTTTTHTPPPDCLPFVRTGEGDPAETLASAPRSVAFAATAVENPERVPEKVRGYDPDTVSDLFAAERFDWLLVKADGARRREFKAPGDHEPAMPAAATLAVPVASVRAVGESLSEPVVHRPDRVAAVTGVAVGEEVTAGTVGTVLASGDGGLKDVPAGARVVPVVNKADTPALRETARAAARTAIARSDGRIRRVLVTSFETGYCEVVTE